MRAIILAAGAGKRLGTLTNEQPKCLLKIGSKTLIEHQLFSIRQVGITDVTLVVGYKHELICDFLSSYPLNITYVYNQDFDHTNTIHSLWLARTFMKSDFMYFNADVLAHPIIVEKIATSPHSNALAIEKKQCREEEVKVIIKNNKICAIGKKLDMSQCTGEFIGIGKFGSASNQKFIDCLEKYQTENNKQLFFESAVNDLLQYTDIYPVDISSYPCIEIDFKEDLENAYLLAEKHRL